jgi:UDP-glucuronate decarboxylase
MNVVITGGTGFIGSHLCDYLIKQGNTVYCIDNNYSGNIGNIKHLIDNTNFTFIEENIIHFDIAYFNSIKIDQIYHLACPASPRSYQREPIETLKTSFIGTLNMLELAKMKKATILFTSTSEIYGDPLQHPQVESYWGNVNPIGIRSCYDEGKRVSETLMMDYYRTFNINIKIARLFNTYGPNMDKNDGRVVSNFINQLLDNKNITIYGNGLQTRSFCYISDTLTCLIKLMNSKSVVIGPINIGNPNEMSINDLAYTLKLLINNSESRIIFEDLPDDDPKVRRPCIKKANDLLDWEPDVVLLEGLKNTIQYFKNLN